MFFLSPSFLNNQLKIYIVKGTFWVANSASFQVQSMDLSLYRIFLQCHALEIFNQFGLQFQMFHKLLFSFAPQILLRIALSD